MQLSTQSFALSTYFEKVINKDEIETDIQSNLCIRTPASRGFTSKIVP